MERVDGSIICDKKVSKKLTVFSYKTVICSVLLYRVEVWSLIDYLTKRFGVCKMRMLLYCLEVSLEKHKTKEAKSECHECVRPDEKKKVAVV